MRKVVVGLVVYMALVAGCQEGQSLGGAMNLREVELSDGTRCAVVSIKQSVSISCEWER